MHKQQLHHRYLHLGISQWLCWCLLLSAALLGCTSGEDTAPPAVGSEGEVFETFYERFHADAEFQLKRIQFPLQGVSSNPADYGTDFRWQAEDWQIHRPFAAESGFSVKFTRVSDDLVIERITDASGQYGMERRFARLDGENWLLIFYADLHPLQ
jgi:hypothetical protein